MSEAVTLSSGESETVYGTFANAKSYLGIMIGDAYTAWRALSDDDKKRTLATATRYLNRQAWIDTADTFAERDALTNAEGKPVFQYASYELAAVAADDPSVLASIETGSNLRAVGAGSARVEFFAPTSTAQGTSGRLPDVALQLVGAYLAASATTNSISGGYGQSGECESQFEDSGEFSIVSPR